MKRLLCFLTPLVPLSAATLWFGPYLQDVRTDRATVVWAARGTGPGGVRVTGSGADLTAVSQITELSAERTGLSEPLYLHQALVTGLKPATEYRYSLFLNGAELPPSGQYRIPTPGAPSHRMLVIGDSGDGNTLQRDLAAYLEHEEASVLLHVGDMAYWEGTFAQFADAFFGVYARLLSRMALFTTPGNHDYEQQDAFPYRTLFAPPVAGVPIESHRRYYSFDWGSAHFVVLDTNTSLEQAIEGSGRMLSWLERDLRTTEQPFRVVLLHHAPFTTSAEKIADPVSAMVRLHVTPLLERAAVHLVLSGHEHVYQRTHPRRSGVFSPAEPGTVYVTTGGAGSQHYEPGPSTFTAKALSALHAVRLDLRDNILQLDAIGLGGVVLDSARFTAIPQLRETAAVNAASFESRLAPGGLMSLFGWNLALTEAGAQAFPLPLELGGAKVAVGTTPLPLTFASRAQINALLPLDLAPSTEPFELTVTTKVGLVRIPVRLQPVAPAVFTVSGVAAALHADGRLVTESLPAATGEWLAIYGTGLGRVNGSLAAGAPAPASPLLEVAVPVRAFAGGREAEVAIACLAPGLAGVYQVNLRVPPGLPPGPQPLTLLVNGVASPAVRLPVR